MDQDSPSIDFLYDFLYVDSPRVNSWLAQLHKDGVPIEFKKTASTSDQSSAEISGGVPGFVKAGEATSGTTIEGHERKFNSELAAPLNLLDLLDEHGYINREIQNAQIGSLIVVTGTLHLLDFEFLQKIWAPAMKLIAAQTKITHGNKAEVALQKSQMDVFSDIIKAMPSEPQVYLITPDGKMIWSALNNSNMTINTAMIALAHGAKINGTWSMLAAVDARPDQEEKELQVDFEFGAIAAAVHNILQVVRESVGRPPSAYAVTPILIFRETRPASQG